MADKCEFPYPAEADALAAAANLADMVTGTTPMDDACFLHCAWVVQGYMLGAGAQPCPPCTPDQKAKLKEALKPVSEAKGDLAKMKGFNWAAIFKAVLEIILSILNPSVAAGK